MDTRRDVSGRHRLLRKTYDVKGGQRPHRAGGVRVAVARQRWLRLVFDFEL